MNIPGGLPQWPACKPLGMYFESLLSSPDWVRRRVETVEVINTVRFERAVSLDIDVDELADRAAGCGIPNPKFLYVPVASFKKRLLIDFDIVDQDGITMSLVTSDEDSYAALAMLLATAENSGIDPSSLSSGALQKLHDIVRYPPSDADTTVIADASRFPGQQEVPGWQLKPGYNVTGDDVKFWRETLFADASFVSRVAEFTTQYMPIISLNRDRTPTIVKYRTIESEPAADVDKWTLAERLGWNEIYFGIETPSIGRAQREHVRIASPGGVFAVSVDVAVAETLDSGPLTPQTSGSEFTGRVTPERALVYTSGRQSSDSHQVIVGIRPTIAGFRTPAIIGTLLSALVLIAGAVGQWTGNVLGKIVEHSTDPAVAVLMVIPSLIAAYLVREGEHEVRSKLLSAPRGVVMLTSGLTIVAAIATIAQLSGHVLAIIWIACGGACVVALIYLCAVCTRIARHHKRIVAASNSQSTQPILKL